MIRCKRINYNRERKPVVSLVCEGRNKTEKKFFNHFKKRDALYNLKIYDCEQTDINNMAKKCRSLFKQNQMNKQDGDRIFCLIDLDLLYIKYEKLLKVKQKYKEVNFIVSNPCFEIWLLFYFTDNPAVESSSQNVKAQLKKYIPDYMESMDVVEKYELQDKHATAVNRSVKKKNLFRENLTLLNKNPYTEIDDLVTYLIDYNKDEFND